MPSSGDYLPLYNPGGPGPEPFPGVRYSEPSPYDLEPVVIALDDPLRVSNGHSSLGGPRPSTSPDPDVPFYDPRMGINFVDPAVSRRSSRSSTSSPPHWTRHDGGVVGERFPDSVEFLEAVGEAITARRPGIELARWNKGDASAIANDAMLGEIEAECAAVVAAYGH